jgi:hypothetical protein
VQDASQLCSSPAQVPLGSSPRHPSLREVVPHKGNETLRSAKPDLKENGIPRENKVEALCMEEGRTDLHVTTIEPFAERLVFYSQ